MKRVRIFLAAERGSHLIQPIPTLVLDVFHRRDAPTVSPISSEQPSSGSRSNKRWLLVRVTSRPRAYELIEAARTTEGRGVEITEAGGGKRLARSRQRLAVW